MVTIKNCFHLPPLKGNINRYVINIFKGIYEIQGFVSFFRTKSESKLVFKCRFETGYFAYGVASISTPLFFTCFFHPMFPIYVYTL